MKNKILSFFTILAIFVMSTNITAFADSSNNNSTITYFENGMYCITTMELDDSNISVCSTTKTGTKTSTYYNSSDTAVCAIKLTGTFSYEAGSYVECTNVSYKTLQYDSNWSIENVTTSYRNETLSSTAVASYKVIHRSLGIIINRASDSNYVKCTIYGVLS